MGTALPSGVSFGIHTITCVVTMDILTWNEQQGFYQNYTYIAPSPSVCLRKDVAQKMFCILMVCFEIIAFPLDGKMMYSRSLESSTWLVPV